MAADLCPFWCPLGDTLFNERCLFELAWVFYREEEKKGLESYSSMLVLDSMEGEK